MCAVGGMVLLKAVQIISSSARDDVNWRTRIVVGIVLSWAKLQFLVVNRIIALVVVLVAGEVEVDAVLVEDVLKARVVVLANSNLNVCF